MKRLTGLHGSRSWRDSTVPFWSAVEIRPGRTLALPSQSNRQMDPRRFGDFSAMLLAK